jgi:hypothetical protein
MSCFLLFLTRCRDYNVTLEARYRWGPERSNYVPAEPFPDHPRLSVIKRERRIYTTRLSLRLMNGYKWQTYHTRRGPQ